MFGNMQDDNEKREKSKVAAGFGLGVGSMLVSALTPVEFPGMLSVFVHLLFWFGLAAVVASSLWFLELHYLHKQHIRLRLFVPGLAIAIFFFGLGMRICVLAQTQVILQPPLNNVLSSTPPAPMAPQLSFDESTTLLPQIAPRAETAKPPPIARSPEPDSLSPEKPGGKCPPGSGGINVHGLDVERSGGNGIQLGEHSSVCLDGAKSLDNHGQGFLIQPDAPANPQAPRPSPAPPKPPGKK